MAIGQSRISRLVLPIGGRDHILGPPDAAATLVEYGDYQCPYCGQAYHILKAVHHRMGRRLRFAFRHFPLAEIHPFAPGAAEAAEAAGAQGKFWEMHALLFENQPALDGPDLLRYATHLGLELPRFVRELNDHTYEPRVREDFMTGVRSGVNGTPTFFVNGLRHDGPWDADTLIEALTATAAVPVSARG
jgi:protein-disulfide isomerase